MTLLDIIRELRRPEVIRAWRDAVLDTEQRAYDHSSFRSENVEGDWITTKQDLHLNIYRETLDNLLAALNRYPIGDEAKRAGDEALREKQAERSEQ